MQYLKNVNALCVPGSGKYNEDNCGYNSKVAWVIDGATGLNGKNLISDKSDANWYSQWWNRYLSRNLKDCSDIKNLMKKGIRAVKKEFFEKVDRHEVSEFDHPSASISILRLIGDEVEYFILGDCRVYTDSGNSEPIIYDDSVSKLDRNIFDQMLKIEGFENKDLDMVNSMLRKSVIENRMKKNKKDGYWILGFDEEAVENALIGRIKIKSGDRFMIASDGYYAISDKYDIVNEENLLDQTFKKGLNKMIDTLRGFERNRDLIRKIPRFKDMDDSTCVLFEIGGI